MAEQSGKTSDVAAGGAGAGDGGGTLLGKDAGAGGDAGAAGGAPALPVPEHFIPQKFRAMGADGAVDLEASARRLAEGYAQAERRIGAGDLPPKSEDDYKLAGLPEGVDAKALLGDQETRAFLGRAHAAGLTDAQVSMVLAEYAQRVVAQEAASEEAHAARVASAERELRSTWTTPEQYSLSMRAASRALKELAASAEDAAALDRLAGNEPAFIRLLAAAGNLVAEDRSIVAGSPEDLSWQAEQAKIREELSKLPAHDPRRADLLRRQTEAYSRRHNAQRPLSLGGGRTFLTRQGSGGA